MRIIVLYILFVFPAFIKAQELLTPIRRNFLLKEIPAQIPNQMMMRTAAFDDTLALPFFDDFSTSKLFPDTNKWLDRAVYINNNFAINPPSFNVATFDALDRYGNPYSYAGGDPYGLADTLTSKSINLSGNPSDSIYLSFFIEPMGNGIDSVQTRDSLLLDFYNKYGVWVRVWRIPGGGSNSKFRQILIPLTDTNYLHPGFKFRLLNKTGLTGNLNHWHLDYISLAKSRNYADTVYQDITINHYPRSLLKNHRSLPWKQFKNYADPGSQVIDTLTIRARNLDNITVQLTHNYKAYDKDFNLFAQETNALNLNASDTNRYRLKGFVVPLTLSEDSFNRITIKYRASTVGFDQQLQNDSLEQVQEFSNYIAYDDGNAEAGYTLSGPGKAAIKFQLQKADTLKAVKIFFNQAEFDTRDKAFSLILWSVLGNNEKIRYRQELTGPVLTNNINGFATIILDTPQYISTAVYPNLTFYVGWQQTAAHQVNIGFDVNYNELIPSGQAANTNLLYNTFGSWQSSLLRGIPMIRPVFGGQVEDPLSVWPVESSKAAAFRVNVYPNPVRNELHLDIAEEGNYEYQLIDMTGRIQPAIATERQGTIDTGRLKAGIYFLKITERQQMSSVFVKFVKQ